MINILAISGSLRSVSSNTNILKALAMLAAPDDIAISLFTGLAELPHFNPDLESSVPKSVTHFRSLLKAADAVLFCSPEYAHGVPGSLKNALDWVVSSGEFVYKPVALLNASPTSTHAEASLTETLSVMTATIISDACIRVPFMGRRLDAASIAEDPQLSRLLKDNLAVFAAGIETAQLENKNRFKEFM